MDRRRTVHVLITEYFFNDRGKPKVKIIPYNLKMTIMVKDKIAGARSKMIYASLHNREPSRENPIPRREEPEPDPSEQPPGRVPKRKKKEPYEIVM